MTSLAIGNESPRVMPEATLPQVFDDTRVQRIHRKMFRISSQLQHESAFAVYQNGTGIKPSNHLLPKLTSGHDSEEAALRQHTTINISPLVTKPVSATPKAVRLAERRIEEAIEGDNYTACEKLRRAYENLERSGDYEPDEIMGMKIAMALREYRQSLALPTTDYRQDILFESHNHPIGITGLDRGMHRLRSVLYPSGDDVVSYYELTHTNPGLVSGIVASDGRNHGVMLFAAETGRQQDPHGYEAGQEFRRGEAYNLRQLGRHGFVFTVLQLTNQGGLAEGEQSALLDFARQVKC